MEKFIIRLPRQLYIKEFPLILQPNLEIISNQSHDLVTKMNLYQKFGVKEYWIANPKLKSIQIYALNDEELYEQVGVYKNNDVAESNIFADLKVNLEDIFS